MPSAIRVLGLSVFALGTSEFMITGLLPGMAADLGVGIPEAGLLISAFAIGMVVGAPLLAIATLRVPRRVTLMGLLVAFGISHVVGALASGYALLFATRVVSAAACAGFWAVAAATALLWYRRSNAAARSRSWSAGSPWRTSPVFPREPSSASTRAGARRSGRSRL